MHRGRGGGSRRGRGGGGGGGSRNRMSLNTQFDRLVNANRALPIALLNPNRTSDTLKRDRSSERSALYKRFNVTEDGPRVHSSIPIPHLPLGLRTLDQVPQPKSRSSTLGQSSAPVSHPRPTATHTSHCRSPSNGWLISCTQSVRSSSGVRLQVPSRQSRHLPRLCPGPSPP